MKYFLFALSLLASLTTPTYAQSIGSSEIADRIPGAWASGEGAEACRSAPISYFLSDGSYLVFNRFDGPLHAVGRWRVEGERVFLTHTDAPFPENGQAKPETALVLRKVDERLFETVNPAGRARVRTRCTGLVLPFASTSGEAH